MRDNHWLLPFRSLYNKARNSGDVFSSVILPYQNSTQQEVAFKAEKCPWTVARRRPDKGPSSCSEPEPFEDGIISDAIFTDHQSNAGSRTRSKFGHTKLEVIGVIFTSFSSPGLASILRCPPAQIDVDVTCTGLIASYSPGFTLKVSTDPFLYLCNFNIEAGSGGPPPPRQLPFAYCMTTASFSSNKCFMKLNLTQLGIKLFGETIQISGG
jgi:hypothetical protein